MKIRKSRFMRQQTVRESTPGIITSVLQTIAKNLYERKMKVERKKMKPHQGKVLGD